MGYRTVGRWVTPKATDVRGIGVGDVGSESDYRFKRLCDAGWTLVRVSDRLDIKSHAVGCRCVR